MKKKSALSNMTACALLAALMCVLCPVSVPIGPIPISLSILVLIVTTLVLILCHLLTIMREMRGLIAGNLAGIAASFLLAGPLIRATGVTGAAWATVAARGVQAVCCLAVVLWRCRKQFAGD